MRNVTRSSHFLIKSAVLVFGLLSIFSWADPEEKNQWDFSSDEGRASFFAAILNEDPDLVSRNLSFRRDPWEVLPQIDIALKALPQPPPKLGMRSGVVIESVPASVTLSYSEEALAEIKKLLLSDVRDLKDLSELGTLNSEVLQRTGDLRNLRSFFRLVPLLYNANGEKIKFEGTGTAVENLQKRIEKLDRADLDNFYRDLFPNHQMHVIKDALAKRDIDGLRVTLAGDLESILNPSELKSFAAEVEARRGNPKAIKSFLRIAPVLYDEDGEPTGESDQRIPEAQQKIAALTLPTWEAKVSQLSRSLSADILTPPSTDQSPLEKVLQNTATELQKKISNDTVVETMKKGLTKNAGVLGDLSSLKPLAEEVSSHRGDPDHWRAFLRLVPFLYDANGQPLGEASQRTAELPGRIAALNRAELEALQRDTFSKHQLPLIQQALAQRPAGIPEAAKESEARPESNGITASLIRDDSTINQALQSTRNYIDRQVVAAVTPKKIRKNATQAVTGSGNALQIQEIPPEVAVFRGCYGGDCSAFSVPHYSLVPGVRTFLIRKATGDAFTEQPVGYVLMSEAKLGEKTLPYVLTVNGKVSTPMAAEVLRMLAAEYKTDEIVLPDFGVGSNRNLVNTDDIRAAYDALPVKAKTTISMNDSWRAIDKVIGEKSGAYANYYLSKNVSGGRLVSVPRGAGSDPEGIVIQREVPLPYRGRDIKTMGMFERSLLAARVASKDSKLKAIFGVSDEQIQLAGRVSNFSLAKPLTAPEIIKSQELFGLVWKDWAKLPKDLQLAMLLSLSPDERRLLKGYPGDLTVDRLGRDLAKTLKLDKPDHYISTLNLILKIPPSLQSEALAARIGEEYRKTKEVLSTEIAKPAPNAQRLRQTLDLLAQRPRTLEENHEIRKILSKPFFLIPDSPNFTAFLERLGEDFIDEKPFNGEDAVLRRHLLRELEARGGIEASLSAAERYFADPDSAVDEPFFLKIWDQAQPLRDAETRLDTAIKGLEGGDQTTAFQTKHTAEMKALRSELVKNPFLKKYVSSLWGESAPMNGPTEVTNLKIAIGKILHRVAEAAYSRVDQPHFWEMTHLPYRALPSSTNAQYFYAALDALIERGVYLAPPGFLDGAIMRATKDKEATNRVARRLQSLIAAGDWQNPLLARPQLLNLVAAAHEPVPAREFAKTVLEHIELMPEELARVCIGATCLHSESVGPIHQALKDALANGQVSDFLVRDRKTVQGLIAEKSKLRNEAITILFKSPLGTLKYLDLLFSQAQPDAKIIGPLVAEQSHFSYPAFGPLKKALSFPDSEARDLSLKALKLSECQDSLRQMGMGEYLDPPPAP